MNSRQILKIMDDIDLLFDNAAGLDLTHFNDMFEDCINRSFRDAHRKYEFWQNYQRCTTAGHLCEDARAYEILQRYYWSKLSAYTYWRNKQ